MIYFVQPPEGGPVKIGTSEDVPNRTKQLESRYNTTLSVLATMEGGIAEEQRIIAKFRHLRIGRTEQFRPAPDLMEFIGNPSLGSPEDVPSMPSYKTGNVFAVRGTDAWAVEINAIAADFGINGVPALFDQAVREFVRTRDPSRKIRPRLG